MKAIKKLLSGKYLLLPQNTEIVLRKKYGSWDSYGVRDPATLVDEDGYIYPKSELFIYYTGSSNGKDQKIGLLRMKNGKTIREQNPVLSPQEGSWDRGFVSTPWCVKCEDGLIRMYYRGGKDIYQSEGLGLAISQDGKTFKRVKNSPLITVDDIHDISKSKLKFMGVMNFAKTFDGKKLVLFEGRSYSSGNKTQIFAVESEDYENFSPVNDGYPILSAKHISSCDAERVANPRLLTFPEEGIYMLVFNCAPKETLYSIGIAFSHDLKNWWEYEFNPILIPSVLPTDFPFSGRLEGGVFLKEQLESETEFLDMYFMAIPSGSKSHENGVIAKVRFRLVHSDIKISFSSFSSADASIRKKGEEVEISLTSGKYTPGIFVKDKSYIRIKGRFISLITEGRRFHPASEPTSIMLNGKVINGFLGKIVRKVILIKSIRLVPLIISIFGKISKLMPSEEKKIELETRNFFLRILSGNVKIKIKRKDSL